MEKTTLSIDLSAEQFRALETLAKSQATPGAPPVEVLRYLVQSMADGIRRPGSWEAQCVAQLFGPVVVESIKPRQMESGSEPKTGRP